MYPRSAKRRKRNTTKLGLRILQSGVAVSVLLMYTSNQIGSTYGEFHTTQEQISSIGLCSVFPGQIEQLLSEFSGHLRTITELKATLGSYSISGVYNTSLTASGLSLDELDQATGEISAQLLQASSEIAALGTKLSFNGTVWQQILQEIGSAAAILQQLGGYIVNLEPNCLEIRDAQFFEQMQENLHLSGILSESLTDTLTGIVNYLSTIHDIGGSLPTGNPDRVLLREATYGFPAEEPVLSLITQAYNAGTALSPELQATYGQFGTELTAAKDNLSSTVSTLQERLAEIAEAKTALLDKAKAVKEEDERLALEKAKAEEAAAEARRLAEEQAKNTPRVSAAPDGNPSVGEPPLPAASPEAEFTAPTIVPAVTPAVNPSTTSAPETLLPEANPADQPDKELNGSVPDSGQPATAVAAAATATPSPESDTSKGGE
ncbi:hypothetical protein KDC22_02040 [Paenibacillus tritici]|uniref:hypothetical protein n=1 Tax=Paenibacillus tritici TaxID=1873425 RepID=UPI001BA75B64|nr:hypothetical protein [Paenibacillus tritici]QUL55383.1 hypothetical protein KDC22_02040 [Paenibacillus tritici]